MRAVRALALCTKYHVRIRPLDMLHGLAAVSSRPSHRPPNPHTSFEGDCADPNAQCISSIPVGMAYQGMGGGNGLRSPREESSFLSLNHAAQNQNGDGRATLHRRFTTNNIPTLSTPLSPIGQQRRQAAEPAEFTTAVCRHSRTKQEPEASAGPQTRFAIRRPTCFSSTTMRKDLS